MKDTSSGQTYKAKKSKNAKSHLKSNPNPSSAAAPTDEQIAALAYSIWEQEGRPEGRDLEHWRAAEAQLRQTSAPSGPPGE